MDCKPACHVCVISKHLAWQHFLVLEMRLDTPNTHQVLTTLETLADDHKIEALLLHDIKCCEEVHFSNCTASTRTVTVTHLHRQM
jgi:hypothetical protein